MILALLVLVTAFFIYYALSPFFEKQYRKKVLIEEDPLKADLVARKEENLTSLNDLEYDYKLKKISEADYLQLKEKMTREAIEVMKKLDSLEEKRNEAVGVATKHGGSRRKIHS